MNTIDDADQTTVDTVINNAQDFADAIAGKRHQPPSFYDLAFDLIKQSRQLRERRA